MRQASAGAGLKVSRGIVWVGLDFHFVRMVEELSAQPKRFPLQGEVDEIHGLTSLCASRAVGDLAGVELQGQPVDGDGFHAALSRTTRWIKRAKASVPSGRRL